MAVAHMIKPNGLYLGLLSAFNFELELAEKSSRKHKPRNTNAMQKENLPQVGSGKKCGSSGKLNKFRELKQQLTQANIN